MFVVPTETPGIEILRNVGTMNERDDLDEGTTATSATTRSACRSTPCWAAPGEGFKVAQARLGGGRVHHAMRMVGKCQRAFDMMLRAGALPPHPGQDARRAPVRAGLHRRLGHRARSSSDCWCCRPPGSSTTSRTAPPAPTSRMCKVALAQVLHDIVQRAVQLHGSLGTTHETPLGTWWANVPQLALADGPTEVHKSAVARGMLSGYRPRRGCSRPTTSPPAAPPRARYAAVLEGTGCDRVPRHRRAVRPDRQGRAGHRRQPRASATRWCWRSPRAGADVVIASRKLDACKAMAEEVEAPGGRRCRSPATSATGTSATGWPSAAYDALRHGRHPGQQRRHVAAGAVVGRDVRGTVRQGDRGELQGPVPARPR